MRLLKLISSCRNGKKISTLKFLYAVSTLEEGELQVMLEEFDGKSFTSEDPTQLLQKFLNNAVLDEVVLSCGGKDELELKFGKWVKKRFSKIKLMRK